MPSVLRVQAGAALAGGEQIAGGFGFTLEAADVGVGKPDGELGPEGIK